MVLNRAAATATSLTLNVVQQSLGALEALLQAPLLLLQLRQTPAALVQLHRHTVLLLLQLLGSRGNENIMLKKGLVCGKGTWIVSSLNIQDHQCHITPDKANKCL